MEVLRAPPQGSSFTPLVEHQSRTPESFYNGKPVLHYHSERCKIVILESELARSPALRTLRGSASDTNGSETVQGEAEEKEIVIDGVDVWAASDKFVLYRTAASSGVAIPYPLISLHAIQRLRLPDSPEGSAQVQGLYMQIANPNPPDNTGAEEDEEEDSINLTIVPAAPASEDTETATATTTSTEDAETKQEETTTQSLFAAVSACSNLHPDPVANGEDGDDDDEYDGNEQPGVGSLLQSGSVVMSGAADGGLPPPMDGSSGWITADNLHEYFDEEGNWIGEGEPPSLPGLGPGAGNVHERDDGPTQNGEGGEEDETKWRRLD